MKDEAIAHTLVTAFFQSHSQQENALMLTKKAIESGLDVNCVVSVENFAYYLKEAPILHHAVYNNLDKVVGYLLSLKNINISAVAVYRDITCFNYNFRIIEVWNRQSDLKPRANGFRIFNNLLDHGAYIPEKSLYR